MKQKLHVLTFLFLLLNLQMQAQREIPVNPQFTNRLNLIATLSGSQEVPAVTTNATGIANVTFSDDYTTFKIQATVTGLSAAITGAHIHAGAAGSNGGVIFNLTPNVSNNKINATFALTNAQLRTFLSEGYYINIHTSTNPGGEIRGQILVDGPIAFSCVASSAQEVPTNPSTGIALASVLFYPRTNSIEIRSIHQGLTGAVTGIHLHRGAAGANGGVVLNLASSLVGNTINARADSINAFASDLLAGNVYLNIHTAQNTGGEIRGQLNKVKGIAFDGWLSAAQEIPVVASTGKGMFFGHLNYGLDSVMVQSLTDSLSSPVNNGHIHTGAIGVSGGVLYNFATALSANRVNMPTFAAVNANTRNGILAGTTYVNIHTANFTGGEVRGQILRVASEGHSFDLCQNQEVTPPVNAGNSAGTAYFSYTRNLANAYLALVVNQLSSTFSGAHIHNAARGANGGIVYNFGSRFANNALAFDLRTDYTSALHTLIKSGSAYVNVHTSNNTGGEIRGQIEKTAECVATASVFSVNKAHELKIFPNPVIDRINLDFGHHMDHKTSIVNMAGQTVLTVENINDIDVSSLGSGIYLINSVASGKTYKATFVKR
jgi:Cu/Zn superoxide dismutase